VSHQSREQLCVRSGLRLSQGCQHGSARLVIGSHVLTSGEFIPGSLKVSGGSDVLSVGQQQWQGQVGVTACQASAVHCACVRAVCLLLLCQRQLLGIVDSCLWAPVTRDRLLAGHTSGRSSTRLCQRTLAGEASRWREYMHSG
jgi:hypothetical protein